MELRERADWRIPSNERMVRVAGFGRLGGPANPPRGWRVGALLSHAKGDISSRLLVAGTSP